MRSNNGGRGPDLTIAMGGTVPTAGVLALDFTAAGNRQAKGFGFKGPAVLAEPVVLEGSFDGGETYATIQSGGVDVDVFAGKITSVKYIGWTHVRPKATATAASRTFQTWIR